MENTNKLQQFPLLITLIIGMSGWLINYLVDNVKEKPIIEYTVAQKLIGDYIQYNYTFENVSSNKNYDELVFAFESKSRCNLDSKVGDSIFGFNFKSIQFISLEGMEPQAHEKTTDLQVPSFQPNARLDVQFYVSKERKIDFSYTSPVPLLLTKPSLQTFFIKNETTLFFVLLLIYSIIMAVYLLINHKKF